MGYSSYISSDQALEFSRPLNGQEIRELQKTMATLDWASYFLSLDIDEQSIDTADGTLLKRTAERLSAIGNEGKAYGLTEDLQILINSLPLDVAVTGYLERIGEEWPDAERLHVLGRRVVSVKAEIVWPEPS